MNTKLQKLFLATVSDYKNIENIEIIVSATLSELMIQLILPKLKKEKTDISEIDLYHYGFTELLVDCMKGKLAGILTTTHIKQIINDCWYTYAGYDLMQYCIETKLLDEVSGNDLLELIRVVISENPKVVSTIQSGNTKAVGSLVGSVLKKQKGDPRTIQQIIFTELNIKLT